MTLVGEAIARYHKLIESEPYIDLAWAGALQERLKAEHLTSRPVSPVLRPHLLASRDFAALDKAAGAVLSAIDRATQAALSNPALLSRLQLLPAERMLAGIDPGYSPSAIPGMLDSNMHNGSLRFVGHRANAPASVVYSDALAGIYYDAPPVKEFRKKYKLTRLSATKALLHAVLKAYKEFGGKQKKPSVAIIESRAPFQPAESSENAPLVEALRREGLQAELVLPDQLEYRNSVLRRGEWPIDIVFRAVRLQEFLVRFDLNHPLMRAYKERAVCMVNNFRGELAAKRAMFDLLTDESVTKSFPAAERKAIKDFIPWTRVMQAAKTTHKNHAVDLPEFVMKHRARLVLKPNDESTDLPAFRGADTDDIGWEKAMRTPYVVQEAAEPARAVFPLVQYGSLVMKEMHVEIHPHFFNGKPHGASSWLGVAGSSGFSTLAGLAPTFLLEGK